MKIESRSQGEEDKEFLSSSPYIYIFSKNLSAGYKIETPKLEFSDSKHGEYLLKPEYHKLTASDYGAKPGQTDFLMKDYSHKSCPDYLNHGKPGDNSYSQDSLYNDKYFPPKQF